MVMVGQCYQSLVFLAFGASGFFFLFPFFGEKFGNLMA